MTELGLAFRKSRGQIAFQLKVTAIPSAAYINCIQRRITLLVTQHRLCLDRNGMYCMKMPHFGSWQPYARGDDNRGGG